MQRPPQQPKLDSRSKGAPKVRFPDDVLLKAFRTVDGHQEEIAFRDTGISGEILPEIQELDADGKLTWRSFDRLVLTSKQLRSFLVLDVVPDGEAKIELKRDRKKQKSSLAVECKIRCLLVRTGHIEFRLTISKDKRKLTYTQIEVRGPFLRNNTEEPIPPGIFPFNLYPAPQDNEDGIRKILQTASYKINLEEEGFRSRFAEAFGIDLKATASTGPERNQIELFFEKVNCEKQDQQEVDCAYGVGFRASRPDRSDDRVRVVPLFRLEGSVERRIVLEVASGLMTGVNGWRITQRASREIKAKRREEGPATTAEPARWQVTLGEIPAKSFYDKWNLSVSDYWKALNTVRGGSPLSLLPHIETAGGSESRWEASFLIMDPTASPDPRFDFGDAGPSAISISGLGVAPSVGYALRLQLGQLKTHNGQDLYLRGDLRPAALPLNDRPPLKPSFELNFSSALGFTEGPNPATDDPGRKNVRIGALDLVFADQPATSQPKERYCRIFFLETLTVEVEADIALERIRPGGQDDPPGEEFVAEGEGIVEPIDEGSGRCTIPDPVRDPAGFHAFIIKSSGDFNGCLESRFRRKSPLVIDLVSTTASTIDPFFLHASEQAESARSQTVRLNLLNQTGAPGPASESDFAAVIIMDRNPFLVAEVRYTPFSKQVSSGGSIAEWTNAGIEGASWQVRQGLDSKTDIVLPSQGIGEEMERGYPFKADDGKGYTIREGELVDFRLSPAAHLRIDVADQKQSFVEAPWNLRRILGYPGQRTPGANVRQLQFELLYGLSCDINTTFIRLAEMTSLIGAVPARLRQQPRWMPGTRANDETHGEEYQKMRFEWSELYRRYLSRIAILEPWDSHESESLILSDVTCRIRAHDDPRRHAAELANPIDADHPGEGLKGGVTWGFEFKNVYNAVMRGAPDKDPESTSASVSDLHFSSLGGWGRLTAGFDKDRTKIYDDVALGRTYTYKLERIGRIGCWWNRAKHVIVYERTVVPSRQFKDKQVKHAGRPIVRKVREFIKFLDEKRDYPDYDAALSPSELQVLEKKRGFVAAFSFQPGDEIPVDSSWGTDVGTIGWKIPLWNPGADQEVYPKPDLKVHLFSDVGNARPDSATQSASDIRTEGVSQPVPACIAKPENVYFYTDTREETSGDPNQWPPIKGVDYVDCPLPRPQADFDSGSTRQTTPNDVAMPAGFGPCTFTLDPPSVPADLVAARAGRPLSAALETVTMVRAVLSETAQREIPSGIKDKFDRAIGLGKNLKKPLADVLQHIPDEGPLTTTALDELKRRVEDSFASGGFHDLFQTLDQSCRDLTVEVSRIGDLVKNRERELFGALEAQIIKLTDENRRLFLQEIEQVLTAASLPLDEKKRRLLTIVDQQLSALESALLLVRLSPGLLQKSVFRAAEAAKRLISDTDNRIHALFRRVTDEYPATLTLDQLKNLTRDLIRAVDSLFSSLDGVAATSLEAWLPDPAVYIIDRYLVDPSNAQKTLRVLINDWKGQLTVEILNASTLTQAAALQALRTERFLVAAVRGKVEELSTNAKNYVDAWRDRLVGDVGVTGPSYIDRQITALRAFIRNAGTDAALRDFPNLVTNMLETEISGTSTENLRKTLVELRAKLEEQVSDPTKGLLRFAEGAARVLCDKVNDLNALKAKVLEAFSGASAEARAVAQAVHDALSGFHADVNRYADAAVGLFQKDELWPQAKDVYAAGNTALAIVRAFGKPPVVPNLTFQRPALAYFYRELSDRVDLTPVLSAVSKASAIGEALKPLGISLPTEALAERLVPPDLRNFDLSKIFPDFGGLNLKHMFPALKLPSAANDHVKVSHGVDPQTRRAWVDAVVNFQIDQPTTLFSVGPLSVRLVNARFEASAHVEAGVNQSPKRSVSGGILGDWELTLGGQTIVIFRRTEVRFDESGGLKFNLNPRNVELPGILSFIQDFLKSFSSSNSGLSIGLVPGGVQALLSLPIPDVQVGAFGMSNLRLGAALKLVFADEGFAIAVGFNLARKQAPFALTIFILGGGGYLEVESLYVPAKQRVICTVDLGITACASLAIALGPIKGGVYVYFGVTAQFRSGAGGGLTIGVMFLVRGEVSILGIAEACVSLLLEAQYSNGRLIGHGNLSIKIKICWCFTLEISEDVTYEIGGGGGNSSRLNTVDSRSLLAFNDSRTDASHEMDPISDASYAFPLPASGIDDYVRLTAMYIDLLA